MDMVRGMHDRDALRTAQVHLGLMAPGAHSLAPSCWPWADFMAMSDALMKRSHAPSEVARCTLIAALITNNIEV